MGRFSKFFSVGFVFTLLAAGIPAGLLHAGAKAFAQEDRCSSEDKTCCCGMAGMCQMCRNEHRAASILKITRCPGPVEKVAAPGAGPECTIPKRVKSFLPAVSEEALPSLQLLKAHSISLPLGPPPPRFLL